MRIAAENENPLTISKLSAMIIVLKLKGFKEKITHEMA